MKKIAAFIIAKKDCGDVESHYHATTRPDGGIGFPGGKANADEDARAAAIRECVEEGWLPIGVSLEPIYSADIDGFSIFWFHADTMFKLQAFKEMGRIEPVMVTKQAMVKSGFGNDSAINAHDIWMTTFEG
jgi:8-oxo-dGTP pyrophosphatase MutT (NUDIX family)